MIKIYQALYRKWRPRTFEDVVGQEHITETLKNQIASGRFSHAYLFIGTRGTGKTTCAKILARAVNCEHPVNGDPCNECPSCRGIEDGSVMDVVEMDAASNNGVDEIRALRDEAVFCPASVKRRVYIVDEVHMLSNSAFNALLKIIEEPPEHLIFILATTELNKVPATILSRCQRYSFRRISAEDIAGRLSYVALREGLALEPEAAALLGRLADGSMRDGLSLLDQCSGSENIDVNAVLSAMGLVGNLRTARLLKLIAAHNTPAALELFAQLWQDGKDPAALLTELCALQRDVLVSMLTRESGLLSGGYDRATLSELAKSFTREELLHSIGEMQEAAAKMRFASNPRTVAELCIVRLTDPALTESLSALSARVARLEKGAVAFPNQQTSPEPVIAAAEVELPLNEPISPTESETVPEPEAPVAEPVAEPVPEPQPPASEQRAAASDPTWGDILAALKGKLSEGDYNVIAAPIQGKGEIAGDTLYLRMSNSFIIGLLNRGTSLGVIREEASRLAGRELAVKTELVSKAQEQSNAKIDSLERFGGVVTMK